MTNYKAPFTLVNKQNCRISGSENPQVIAKWKLYPVKVTVGCALWSEGVIRPYFFTSSHFEMKDCNDQLKSTFHTR